MFGMGWPQLWQQVNLRMTNVDLVAGQLSQVAMPGDVIVVNPWWVGIPFGRNYHGQAEWVTVPEIEDHRCHRYDLIKQRMIEDRPLISVFEKINQTLRSGHRVYFGITEDIRWQPGQPIPQLPPAPQGPTGWYEPPYEGVWSQQVFAYLSMHAGKFEALPEDVSNPVHPHERMEIVAFSDWVE